ncbi:ly6/PLAUR domain-containing protein 1 isoform X2 [Zalophus californianus]|uniref:Ly6/PLAUR domain-containing protein 1 isoform X2 n=1 Tax=Zalophus californianus TaxID=9704 RepID=A0A6J2CLU0_ZALCA|nr:ly6/PLAUR domain-containing protein 1 isoform X2 [Zalophus californianus]
MWVLGIAATFCGLFLLQGFALQIQCYQCEEFQLNNDCSSPEFIVNCTVNVQDMCQKEVMEQSAGCLVIYTRKDLTEWSQNLSSNPSSSIFQECDLGHHVPQVVCIIGSLPHRLGRVPILLLPWETELSVHQLL